LCISFGNLLYITCPKDLDNIYPEEEVENTDIICLIINELDITDSWIPATAPYLSPSKNPCDIHLKSVILGQLGYAHITAPVEKNSIANNNVRSYHEGKGNFFWIYQY
jgi:hypothetical protein